MTLKHLSLCTGYGGLDLAVEALLDTELVALAEFDPHAAKICAARFPGVPNLHDIKTIDWEALPFDVDLITAGYPCQPFSLAGKRKGTDDDRHLWPYIAEAIRHLRPRLVVLENVYGHLSKGFGDVVGALASLGYDARWDCVRASDTGAPHKRERVFIVAADTRRQRAARLAGELPRAAAQDRRSGVDLRAAVDAGAGDLSLLPTPTANEANGAGHAAQGGRNLRTEVASLLPTPASRDYKGNSLQSRTAGPALPDAVSLLPTPTVNDSRGGRNATSGRSKGEASEHHSGTTLCDVAYSVDWGKYAEAIERWEGLFRPAPMPSEPNTKGGRRLHAPFVEWMMGLPEGWVTDVDIPRTQQLKALGNGVVPQQAYLALEGLL